ncbi:hypothetical protein JAB1_14190 [Janthinobacterium sp. MP5059B]|uniref:hypothetical protein n=1 Tax=Janthinobacterium sp. MP5059B TaxID=1766683 RepID=UPI0008740C18|nr:hypothetical protein [Janthinobacterium sp. MP5059B]OEZ50304.1 hypothetical protein JAB1_14190 [Janthinobacterium sp. MP5059B]
MSARDHDAAQLQAELAQHHAPAPRFHFDVTIHFTDGTYRNKVRARNKSVAHAMALTDARMASPCSTFYGKELGHLVELAKQEQRSPAP